jgi:catechol 2,3-dioxygenase-like lactoylglutathione lyase family enzyme
MATTYGLTHIAISVSDLDRTKRFYQEVFDLEVMYDTPDFIQLTTPGSHDVLVFEKKQPDPNTGGIAHFGFRLRKAKDIDILLEKIRIAGGNIKSSGEFVPGSPYVFFNDPDGYEVEVWFEKID